MNRKGTKFITTTAILIALTIVFQLLGRYIPLGPNNNFIIGPLVNACLFISTAIAGLWGGTIVGLISPFGAIITGSTIPLPFVPFIVIGNFSLVLTFYLFRKRKIVGIATAAVIKTTLLFASITIMLSVLKLPAKKASMMLFLFSWPQLITALVGGALAMVVLNRVHNHVDSSMNS